MTIDKDQDDSKPPITNVSDIVGDWGKWQLNICVFCTSMALFSAFNNLSGSFYGPKTDFKCVFNGTEMAFECPAPGSNITCDSWNYDKSVFQRSIITEWNLVCEREWLVSFTQSVYMVGVAISALLFGYLSDKYGRIRVLYAGIALEIIGGLLSTYSPNIVLFTVSRLILSIGSYGRNLTAFLIGIECVGPKYRAKIGIGYQLGWALGYVVLPGLAYLCRDYVNLFLCITLPELLWLAWLRHIPESPKWLISRGQYDQAESVLRNALKFNGKSESKLKEQIEALREQIERERLDRACKREITFFDLWRNVNIRNFTLILYFTWFVNAFVYYGISFNIGDFGGDLFVNFALAGAVEVPSYIFTIYAFDYVGRRTLTAVLMLLGGVSCLLIMVSQVWLQSQTMVLIAAMIGKFSITCTFAIIYVYSAELYPTVLRQFAVGSCSIAGRVGSILAPFIKELSKFTSMSVSMSIFAGFSLLDGMLVFLLPETNDQEMPDTLEEASRIGRANTQSRQELN